MHDDTPTFSIVIPAYKRPQSLNRCLEAISRLNYPRERFEVIVVDDGSPTPLYDQITHWSDEMTLRVHVQPNGGPGSARNTGAALATGEFLAFTDDDCAPEPDWLDHLARGLTAHPEAMLGGLTVNALRRNSYSEASQALIGFLHDWLNVRSLQPSFFVAGNTAVRTAEYQAVGGFDTTMRIAGGEDREFCDRWQQSGRPMIYVPEGRVQHYHSLNLRSFGKQHFNYGRGAYWFHRVRAEQSGARLRVEPPRFYLQLLMAGIGRTSWWRTVPVTALLGFSQIANAAGFFWERACSQRQTTERRAIHSTC